MKNLFANVCLVLVSCAVGLALCEVSLRLFYPKYRHLADAQFRSDALRIYARTPNSRDWRSHRDTFVLHSFSHNNLALRQHRDFSEADLAASTNIGVFGDSFVENSMIPAQYSFTEPLDYLLNQSGTPFNVLNFGVNGYGPGQSFLHYENFRHAEQLDHVLFVYCGNDLWELYTTELFHLDEAGHLVRNEAIRKSWWKLLTRRLHTPYLLLDVNGRLSSFKVETRAPLEELMSSRKKRRSDQRYLALKPTFMGGRLVSDDLKNTLEIFRQLIRHWKHSVEYNGSTFSVVLLPTSPPPPFVVDLLNAEDVKVIDLYACFGAADPAHPQQPWSSSPYSFKNDWHWNEAGNRLAAVCLYRALEEQTGLSGLSKGKLQEVLFRYYAAFEGETLEDRGGGLLEVGATIREKYLALDSSNLLKEWKGEFRKMMARPDKRIIVSHFNVYLDGNRLIYVKEGGHLADVVRGTFFLHVIPVNEKDLPKHRRRYGFENRDFSPGNLKIGDGRYVVQRELPTYPIRQIRTGQYVKDAQDNYVSLWEAEFSMAQGVAGGEGED